MDIQKALEKYNSYPIILITISYVVIFYLIQVIFSSDIFNSNFMPITLEILQSILIGVLVCIFTKSDITKGVFYGAICGFIGGSGDSIIRAIFLEPYLYHDAIISGILLGVLVSILTKSDIIKGVIYGTVYSILSYIISNVSYFGADLVMYSLFYSILRNTLFSFFISMLIKSEDKYITRSVFAGIIYGLLSYSIYRIYPYFYDIKSIFVQVLYVNYLYFILYPLTLQKTDVVETTSNSATTDDHLQIETEKEQGKNGKIKWGHVILCTFIGAFIGTLIVYIYIMTQSSGGSFGFFTNMKQFFAMIYAIVYGGSSGSILGFLAGILSPLKTKNNIDKKL